MVTLKTSKRATFKFNQETFPLGFQIKGILQIVVLCLLYSVSREITSQESLPLIEHDEQSERLIL